MITLDVLMPGMDGWSVLAALKADAALADIPVVMLTMLDDRNLGYALGAADYLTKPIDRERLVTVLERYRRDLPVLVVDDDADFRDLARRTLEREGYTVIEAENGRAALDRLRDAAPWRDPARPHDARDGRLRLRRRQSGRTRRGGPSPSSSSRPRTSPPRTTSASTATWRASSRRAL